ncbi:MAG: hypothetical protein ABI808_16085, partial [Pseudonocardiales bacterium]
VPEYVTEADVSICATWYVLVTSASGNSVFATMGPYPTEAGARDAADVARVAHYRLGVRRSGGRLSGLF